MHLDAFTISSKTLRERSPRDSGSSTPKSLPQGRTDLFLQSAWSFQFYTFLEDFVLWFPEFPLVVIMFDCWLAVATISLIAGRMLQIIFDCSCCLLACLIACLHFSFDCFWAHADMIFVRYIKGWLFFLVCWIGYFYFNFLDILVNPCKPSKPGESV